MRIVLYGTDDQDSLFGRDPEAIQGVDVVASITRFQDAVTTLVREEYPEASVEISDRPTTKCCEVFAADDYPLDSEVPWVEQIVHDVWESWAWVVKKGG